MDKEKALLFGIALCFYLFVEILNRGTASESQGILLGMPTSQYFKTISSIIKDKDFCKWTFGRSQLHLLIFIPPHPMYASPEAPLQARHAKNALASF